MELLRVFFLSSSSIVLGIIIILNWSAYSTVRTTAWNSTPNSLRLVTSFRSARSRMASGWSSVSHRSYTIIISYTNSSNIIIKYGKCARVCTGDDEMRALQQNTTIRWWRVSTRQPIFHSSFFLFFFFCFVTWQNDSNMQTEAKYLIGWRKRELFIAIPETRRKYEMAPCKKVQ